MPAPKGNKYANGNKGGRPTKFKPAYIRELIEFFDIEPYKREVMEKSTFFYKDGTKKAESEKYRLIPNNLPTLRTFAKKIGVSYWTVWNWAEKGAEAVEVPEGVENSGKYTEVELKDIYKRREQIEEFSKAYKEAKEIQKEFLIQNGLVGASPSAAYIFTAKNVTDMRDVQDHKHDVTLTFSLAQLRKNADAKNIGANPVRQLNGDTEVE